MHPRGSPPSAANRIQPCPACPKPQVRSAPARLVFRRSRTPPRVLVPTPKSRSAPTPSPPVARTGPVPGASISFPAHPTAWMALRLISTASVGVASTSTSATLSCRTPPCDLSGDALWEQIFSQIRGGEFDAVLIGTPLDLSVAARARRHEGYAQPQNHGRSSRAP